MIHNISTSTSCLLLLLLLFMMNTILSTIANTNAIIAHSTTKIIEISMVNSTIPSIIINTSINRCRTAVTTITITVVVILTIITMIAINTIVIIITSTTLLLLQLLTVFCLYLCEY